MSIISCTSPRASEVILPTSAVTSVARSSLCSVSSSPQRLTSWPRTGAGTSRQVVNASAAAAIAASTSAPVWLRTEKITSPVIGVRTSVSPAIASVSTPVAFRARSTSAVISAVVGKFVLMSESSVFVVGSVVSRW